MPRRRLSSRPGVCSRQGMPARRLLVAAILLSAGLSPRLAAAQDAGAASAEIAALEDQIGRGLAQLSSGCVVACPALASMERAAALLCALDPGPRCADARAKVRDAARRVQQACGECRDQGVQRDEEKNAERAKVRVLEAPPQPASVQPTPSPALSACASASVPGRAGLCPASRGVCVLHRRRRRSRRVRGRHGGGAGGDRDGRSTERPPAGIQTAPPVIRRGP